MLDASSYTDVCPETKYFTEGGNDAPEGNDELVLPAGCKAVQDAFTDFWIKAKLDPQGLFQCQKCVGFKGPVRDQ